MKNLTLREQLVIKLTVFLIKFIGRHTDGFYSFELDELFKEQKRE